MADETRISSGVAEIIASGGDSRSSQLNVEVLASSGDSRASQISVEHLSSGGITRASQIVVEVLANIPRTLSADTGSYATTGNIAALLRGLLLSTINGSYLVTGNSATLIRQSTIPLAVGSYSLTGNDAAFRKDVTLVTDTGSYAVTGNNAALLRTTILPLAVGSYVSTGNDSALTRSLRIVSDTGSYSITGNTVTLSKQSTLPMSVGSYSLTGSDATLVTIDAGRVSSTVAEILAAGGDTRASSALAEVLASLANTTKTRSSQSIAEILADTSEPTRASQVVVEVLGNLPRKLYADTGSYLLSGNNATLIPPAATGPGRWKKLPSGKILKRYGSIVYSDNCCCPFEPCCGRLNPPGDTPEHLPETLQLVLTDTSDCSCIDGLELTLTWNETNQQYEATGPGGACGLLQDNWRLNCIGVENPDAAEDCHLWQLSIQEVSSCIMDGEPWLPVGTCSCNPISLTFNLSLLGLGCCNGLSGSGTVTAVVTEV